MFTEQQIKAAHSKVKTGADFPKYVQEIKNLGLVRYQYEVQNGNTTYYGIHDYKVISTGRSLPLMISPYSSPGKLKEVIAAHQQGKTDFITVCKQVADAGVSYWIVDAQKMLCTYYDVSGNEMMAEPIPEVEY